MNNIPSDWENPDWELGLGKHPHEWKKYPSADVKKYWNSFEPQQKQILASNFQAIADNERWN